MKRLIIVSLAVLCAAAWLPQSLSAGFGIKGGYALSEFKMGATDPIPFVLGNLDSPVGGVFFNLGLGFLTFQPEVLYVRMGAEYEVDENNGLKWQMEYIYVPVLLKVNIIPAGPIRPFICAGGYGAYLLKAKGVATVDGTSEGTEITDQFQRYDYGVVGGAGLTFKLPGIALSVEGRYNYGLQNIMKVPLPGESIKNTSMMALVGIAF